MISDRSTRKKKSRLTRSIGIEMPVRPARLHRDIFKSLTYEVTMTPLPKTMEKLAPPRNQEKDISMESTCLRHVPQAWSPYSRKHVHITYISLL